MRNFNDDSIDGVLQAADYSRVENLVVGKFDAGLLQSDQMSSEIAAVHSRDILWPQWLERTRVAPIQIMPAKLLQFGESRERELGAFQEFD